jgi:amidase
MDRETTGGNLINRRQLLISSAAALAATSLIGAPASAQTVGTPAGASGTSDELWRWTATDLAAAIQKRQITSREATMSCLARIDSVNPAVNAVVDVLADEALATADMLDQVLQSGHSYGPLHGVPVTVKVNVDIKGHATTSGVVAFQNNIASDDSASVRNLRVAGAVIIGRTNCPAFAFRWFSDNDLYGRTYNPWDRSITPGGSSGGAGAAVAVGMGTLAHGNDIAGSVRYPAYCCGVPGIRPSLGRVPSFNPSSASTPAGITSQLLSVQGLLGRTIQDLRIGLEALAARDVRDPWWVPAPLTGPQPNTPLKVALVRSVPRLFRGSRRLYSVGPRGDRPVECWLLRGRGSSTCLWRGRDAVDDARDERGPHDSGPSGQPER